MSIVCGVDFSSYSERAALAAANLAARMDVPLHLVHSIEPGVDTLYEDSMVSAERWTKLHLEHVAAVARKTGARVEIHIANGAPDETLQEIAQRVGSQLIVVAALGHRRAGKWQVGSHAERLAQHAHMPVLVVRDPKPFEDWAAADRPLRILLGVDSSKTSDSALHWIATLRSFGPCEVIAAHLYWPPAEFQRLGLAGVRDLLEPEPSVTKALASELGKHIEAILGEPATKTLFFPHLGSLGARLAKLAQEEAVGLIVVGTHDRRLSDRIAHGSVSHEVLHQAGMSVACVPVSTSAPNTVKRVQNILVATDFSALGNAAVPLAYGIAADGCTIHLVHIVPDGTNRSELDPSDIFPSPTGLVTEQEAAAQRQLLALVPERVDGARPTTRVHVLRSNAPASAICQAAERLDAELICLGTHGRKGLAKLVLGSVASDVLGMTERPVLLARKPRE